MVVRSVAEDDRPTGDPTSLPAADIRAQLEFIRSSPDFDVPERARRFLAYIVEETLAGRAERIKAFSIATEVFGRDASFDAQADPIVRIEAGRIRRALDHYYLTAGRHDGIVISIPKGGYVPVFAGQGTRRREADPPRSNEPAALERRSWGSRWGWLAGMMGFAVIVSIFAFGWIKSLHNFSPVPAQENSDVRLAAPRVPRLLVEPFQGLSDTGQTAIIARGLTEEIVGQLAKFKEIVVVFDRSGSAAQTPYKRASYSLSGNIRAGGNKLRLTARLTRQADGSIVWTSSYDAELKVHDMIEMQVDIARKVAGALAQPYGVIHYADAGEVSKAPPEDWDAYACTLAYYTYRANVGPEAHTSVQACLQRAVQRYPNYATAWALLSLTYVDEVRFAYRVRPVTPAPLDRALESARRAVDLDSQNVRGLQAQMTALFFRKQIDAALQIGARAIALNPNDMELAGEYGIRLALTGNWRRGRELIETALDRDPEPLGYFLTVMALCFYMEGDYPSATEWIRKPALHTNVIYHLVAASIYGQVGDSAGVAAERDWLEEHAPHLLTNVRQELTMRNIAEQDQVHFIEGLRKGGLLSSDPNPISSPSPTPVGNPTQ